MNVRIEMKRLIDDIERNSHTDDEWLALEKKVKRYLGSLPEKERLFFAESCAAEALSMICDGIRYERAMRSYGVEFDKDGMVINWGQLEEGERLEYIPETDEYKRKTNK